MKQNQNNIEEILQKYSNYELIQNKEKLKEYILSLPLLKRDRYFLAKELNINFNDLVTIIKYYDLLKYILHKYRCNDLYENIVYKHLSEYIRKYNEMHKPKIFLRKEICIYDENDELIEFNMLIVNFNLAIFVDKEYDKKYSEILKKQGINVLYVSKKDVSDVILFSKLIKKVFSYRDSENIYYPIYTTKQNNDFDKLEYLHYCSTLDKEDFKNRLYLRILKKYIADNIEYENNDIKNKIFNKTGYRLLINRFIKFDNNLKESQNTFVNLSRYMSRRF